MLSNDAVVRPQRLSQRPNSKRKLSSAFVSQLSQGRSNAVAQLIGLPFPGSITRPSGRPLRLFHGRGHHSFFIILEIAVPYLILPRAGL